MASLAGVRVLVVEDEAMLLLALQDILDELGCELAACAARLTEAMDVAKDIQCDAAILDINLGGERIDAVADILAARGIPFVFATGYGEDGLMARHHLARLMEKPYDSEDLRKALSSILER